MSRVAEQIAEGKWDERVQVNSKDEIGQLATSLNHMAVKIAENEKSRDAFLAGISHELRTPLTTLKANTTAMLDGIIQPEEVHTYLHSNVEEIDRLTLMVNDLILVSTLEQDPALHIERTNVHDLFQSVLLTMRLSLEKKSLGLVIDMPNQLWIDADKFKLKQVFINVIYNAIQHSPQGGNLFIEILPNKHYLRILITDQGPGFSSDSIPHLFKRFYRDQYSSGLGLGLYISQIIIRAHHGKMKAYNSNHGGACIEIEFPMK